VVQRYLDSRFEPALRAEDRRAITKLSQAEPPLRLYCCDHHSFALPAGHKFPVRKYALLREALAESGYFAFEEAPFAETGTIALIHDRDYVERFLSGTLDPAAMRRIGFPWSEGLVRRTLASVGGTLAAAREALFRGFGGSLAGGTHHAFRSEGSGFCVFNDIAVATAALREEGLIARAAVIDLDVHQGDGTAAIFEDDPGVLTISMHCASNFPFRKRPSKIDIDLPDLTGDASYLDHLQSLIPRVLQFEPDIVFFQSGVDALAGDKLGRLALTHAGLAQRDRMVLEACKRSRVPVAIALGGGYAEPIERTVEAHANTFRIAAEAFMCARQSAPERP
jgi:acetoin utilization deacetylase AcuC-like enzyme